MRHKLLLIMVAFMAIIPGANAASPGNVIFTHDISNSGPSVDIAVAIDASNNFHYCTESQNGDTYNFKIYDLDFNLEKDFSIVTPDLGEDRFFKIKYRYPLGLLSYTGDAAVLLTQNLFNPDDKWEVVFEQILKDAPPYGSDKFEKYVVYSESGEKINEFKPNDFFTSSKTDDNDYFQYYFGGKQPYLYCSASIDDDIKSHVWVSFYDTTTSAQSISKPTVRAFPNPLPAGRTLTISLDSPVAYDAKLIVSDMNGRVVYRRNVKPGTDNITVPAGNLRHGMYIYNITAGSDLLQSGKVVAE